MFTALRLVGVQRLFIMSATFHEASYLVSNDTLETLPTQCHMPTQCNRLQWEGLGMSIQPNRFVRKAILLCRREGCVNSIT